LALVFYSGQANRGGCKPMFFATRETAMAYCSDDRTKGKRYGFEWATFWTSARHFFDGYAFEAKFLKQDIELVHDDGRYPEYERLDTAECWDICRRVLVAENLVKEAASIENHRLRAVEADRRAAEKIGQSTLF